MAEDFFDIASLAAYLHMMPAQISRLADRDKLPGRRVGGEWRFSKAEIHHWMEDKMGVSDDVELAKVEGILKASAGPEDQEAYLLEDFISTDTIAIPLLAKTKNRIIEQMANLAATTGMLWDPQKMADGIRDREAMQSTALDNGVALLHPRRPMRNILSQGVLALGMTTSGIPFGGDRSLTDIFFLICSTSDHEHLRLLTRISRMITAPDFLATLREANDSTDALTILLKQDGELE